MKVLPFHLLIYADNCNHIQQLETMKYQPDETQQHLIHIYQSKQAPPTVVALASPGTGKTTTISRIIQAITFEQLIEQRSNFLVLTFTRKTRFDLIDKLKTLPGKSEPKQYALNRVKNFHSLAFDLVQWKHIIDQHAETHKLNGFLKRLKLTDRDQKSLRKEINRVKDDLMARGSSEQEWNQVVDELRHHPRCKFIGRYLQEYRSWLEKELAENWAVTYDYSLIKATEEIRKGGKLRKNCANLDSLDILIVDEFQDCNPAQLKMVDALIQRSQKEVRLLMVGDFDQNIYNWRGADIKFIDQFLRARNPTILHLAHSYRLGNSLKDLSQKLIKSFPPYQFFRRRFYRDYTLHAKGQHDKELQVRVFDEEIREVKWIVDKIYYHMREGIRLGQMSVLVRSFKAAFPRLLINQIKERKRKGQPEIKYEVKYFNNALKSATVLNIISILSYFRKVGLEDCQDDIKRILKPIQHIGEADLVRQAMIVQGKISKDLVTYTQKQANLQKRLLSWNKFFEDWSQIEELVAQCPKDGFLNLCKQIFEIWRKATWGDLQLKEDKVQEFYEIVEEIVESMRKQLIEAQPVFSILHELCLLADRRERGEEHDEEVEDQEDILLRKRKDRLQIQTIHTSKGLQFQVVMLGGLNYAFPSFVINNPFTTEQTTTLIDMGQMTKTQKQKEQLRVIYTAITRSANYCYVNSSINFERPDWLKKSDVKAHPQFDFLRQNAKFCGLIQNDEVYEASVIANVEEQQDQQRQLEQLIRNMEIN